MDAFEVHRRLIRDYREFTEGFVQVRDPRVAEVVARESERGAQWPDAWLSLNPSFASGGRIDELVARGLLTDECDRIFRAKSGPEDRGVSPLTLHQHQRDAIEVAAPHATRAHQPCHPARRPAAGQVHDPATSAPRVGAFTASSMPSAEALPRTPQTE